MKTLVCFTRGPQTRFLSHLDMQRAMQRALRRSGLPIGYSQGFSPHIQLSFATALSVGQISRYEVLDIKMEAAVDGDAFCSALNPHLPAGIHALGAVCLERGSAPMALVRASSYEVQTTAPAEAAIEAFMQKTEHLATIRTKSGEKTQDIRPMVFTLTPCDKGFTALVSHREGATLRPDLLLEALELKASSICRTGLFAEKDSKLIDLMDFYRALALPQEANA